jgi:hypothetical protein
VVLSLKVDIKIKSLVDTLDKIEERLAILQPNKKLEKREKLKERTSNTVN